MARAAQHHRRTRLTSGVLLFLTAALPFGLSSCGTTQSHHGATLAEIQSLVDAQQVDQALARLEALEQAATGDRKLTFTEDLQLNRHFAEAYLTRAQQQEPAFLAPWVNPNEDREYRAAVAQAVDSYMTARRYLREVERLGRRGRPDDDKHLLADDEKRPGADELRDCVLDASLGVCLTYMRVGMLLNNAADLREAGELASNIKLPTGVNPRFASELKFIEAGIRQATVAPRENPGANLNLDRERDIANGFEDFHFSQVNHGFDVPIGYRDLLSFVYPYKSEFDVARIQNDNLRRLVRSAIAWLEDYSKRAQPPATTSPWSGFRQRLDQYLAGHESWSRDRQFAESILERAANSFATASVEELDRLLADLKKIRSELREAGNENYWAVRRDVQTRYVHMLYDVAGRHIVNGRFEDATACLRRAGEHLVRDQILGSEFLALVEDGQRYRDRLLDTERLAELRGQVEELLRAEEGVAIVEAALGEFRTENARNLAQNLLTDLRENAGAVDRFRGLMQQIREIAKSDPTSEERLEKARQLLTVSEKLQPNFKDDALRAVAQAHLDRGDLRDALDRYDAIANKVDLDQANIGLCHYELDEKAEAAKTFLSLDVTALVRLDDSAQKKRLRAAADSTRSQENPEKAYEFYEVLRKIDAAGSGQEARRGMIDCCSLVLAKPDLTLDQQIAWTEKKNALEPAPRELFVLHYQAGLEHAKVGASSEASDTEKNAAEEKADEHFTLAYQQLREYEKSFGSIAGLSQPQQKMARRLYATEANYMPAPGRYVFKEDRDGGSLQTFVVRKTTEQRFEVDAITEGAAPVRETWIHLDKDRQLAVSNESGRPVRTLLLGLPSPETPVPFRFEQGQQVLEILETGFEFQSGKDSHSNCIRVRFYRDREATDRYLEYVLAPDLGPVTMYNNVRDQTYTLQRVE